MLHARILYDNTQCNAIYDVSSSHAKDVVVMVFEIVY